MLNSSTFGIAVFGDGVPVTSNKIMFSSLYGIWLGTLGITIEGNSITTATVGVEFNCLTNPNVHSNTITDALTGVDQVPSGINTPNTYFNVGTVKTGGC